MFNNYFKIAWRNIIRDKVNSFINITGLAIGMACVVLILLYVDDELKYDRFLKDSNRIFQVNLTGMENGIEFRSGNTGPAVGPAMVDEFPEIKTYTRIYRPGDILVRYEQAQKAENYFTEKRIIAVDSNFLDVFPYHMLEGDPTTCLHEPTSVVITKQTAKKYFGNSTAIGKILLFHTERMPLTVTGVLKEIPSQSSLQFDMLLPISSYSEVRRRSWNWMWLQVSSYVKLGDNVATDEAAIAELEAKFPAMVKKVAFKRNPETYEEFVKKGGKLEFHLQPLTRVHLYSAGINSRLTTLGNIKYVRIFSIIALFIIILACVNFMNLSTAQSAKRAKEVGIRKVLGSLKTQLVKQFLTEAMIYSFVATVFALVIVLLFLNPFNQISGKSLSFSSLFAGNIWIYVCGLTILTGCLLAVTRPSILHHSNP